MGKNLDKCMCPFIENPPSDECYCVKLDSLSTEAAIIYCARRFFECRIYKSFSLKNNQSANSGETTFRTG